MDMSVENPSGARYCLRIEKAQVTCVLEGEWESASRIPSARAVLEELEALIQSSKEKVEKLHFDTRALTKWDSGLIAFLFRLIEEEQSAGIKADMSGLPERAVSLLQLALAVPEKDGAGGGDKRTSFIERVGKYGYHFWEETLAGITFIGECTLALLNLARGRAHLRKRDFWQIVQDVGASALPIVALISFLVGLIIAFLGAVVLVRFGADYYVSYLVGYGMLREMGAVMAGIIMAGRTGAAFAAQIGSMKVSEELDALVTLGLSPTEFLVLPRIIALSLMMPVLTVYADIIGISSGMLVSGLMLDIAPEQFWNGLNNAVGGKDFLLGVVKGSIFGVIIAVSGCLRGMQCGSSAGAVGLAATSAVVTGITGIIFANALIDWIAALFGF